DEIETLDYFEKLKDDEEYIDTAIKLKNDFARIYETGMEIESSSQTFTKEGDIKTELYVNKDDMYYQDEDGLGYYDKSNIIINEKNLKNDFKRHLKDKENNTMISVLQWDVDGKFNSSDSVVNPMLLTYVEEASDKIKEEIIMKALTSVAECVLNYPDRVAKEITASMTDAYPNHVWFVTKDATGTHIQHDIYVTVTYDNVDDGEDLISYTIFGLKK
ncbi:hypothetical protein NQ314_013647, partial [Rhamnusium bicolor]